MKNLSKVTAILVLYDTSDIIHKCLENLKDVNIIIVDNGKNRKSLIDIIKKNKNIIKYLKPKKNLGFGRACNLAFKYVKTDYTLLIEPDVIISPKNIYNLIITIEKYPRTGIVAPTLINNNNEIVDKLENFPEYGKNVIRSLHEKTINFQIENKFIEGDTCVNFCWAAILLLNNEIIKKTGLFNKKIFLFWEDFYLCRKLRDAKISIIKSSSSKAIHLERMSTRVNFYNYFIMQKHHVQSSYVYFRVKKNNSDLTKRLFLYFLRSFGYLCILNLKKSLKNIARFCAVFTYKFR